MAGLATVRGRRWDKRGTILARPPASTVPEGARWYAQDQDGGQEYERVGGVWVKRGPAVADANGNLLDYVELAASFASGNQAVVNTDLDLGLQISVVSGARPLVFTVATKHQPQLGGAASPQVLRNQLKLWEQVLGVWTLRDTDSRAIKVATGEAYYHGMRAEWVVVPPAAGTAYTVKATLNTNIANSAFTVFGRSTGAATFLKCEQR